MARKNRTASRPSAPKGSSRVATADQWGDMGEENEIFHTDSLPQTGHDEAIDDDQQTVKTASTQLQLIAATVLKTGNRALARRVAIAARRVAEIGIKEGKTPNFHDLYSTEPLQEPAQDGKALDDSNVETPLQFFGTNPPTKDQVGPNKRASRRQATDQSSPEQPGMTTEPKKTAPKPSAPKGKSTPPMESMTIKFRRDDGSPAASRAAGDDRKYLQDLDFAGDTNFEDDNEPDVTGCDDRKMASRRRADPLPEFKERAHELIDDLDEVEYEEHEDDFHGALDELEQLEALADDAVTTGVEFAGAGGGQAVNRITAEEEGAAPAGPMASRRAARIARMVDAGNIRLLLAAKKMKYQGQEVEIVAWGGKNARIKFPDGSNTLVPVKTLLSLNGIQPLDADKFTGFEEEGGPPTFPGEKLGRDDALALHDLRLEKLLKNPLTPETTKQIKKLADNAARDGDHELSDRILEALDKKTRAASRRRASRQASAPQASAWKTLKASLRRAGSNGGRWASGAWATGVEDFGRAFDLNVNTQDESGAPLIASSVTFSLIKEDPKTRVATIEVSDGVVHNETREVVLDARQASRYASEWAKATERAAKDILSGK